MAGWSRPPCPSGPRAPGVSSVVLGCPTDRRYAEGEAREQRLPARAHAGRSNLGERLVEARQEALLEL